MRTLVIRTGALGDTLLLSPLLQNLRHFFPEEEGHFLGHPERIPLLEGPPNAHRVLSSENEAWLDLHRSGSQSAETLHWLAGYETVICFSSRPDGNVEENLRQIVGESVIWHPVLPPPRFDRHYVDFTLQPLADLGLPVQPFFPAVSEVAKGARCPSEACGRIIIHPGAGNREKRWPLPDFLYLRRELERAAGGEVLFLLGPGEMELAESVEQGGEKVLSGLGLNELVAVLKSCRAFVGNDSGVSHLAASLGVRTVAIFTATDPAVWRPLGKRVEVLDARRASSSRELVFRACGFLDSGADSL